MIGKIFLILYVLKNIAHKINYQWNLTNHCEIFIIQFNSMIQVTHYFLQMDSVAMGFQQQVNV